MNLFRKFSALFVALLIEVAFSATTSAYSENWEISSFHSDIILNNDRSIEVTETIVADFTNEEHMGIARLIPYKFNNITTQIEYINATDENGKAWDTQTFEEGGYFNIEMRNHENLRNNGTHTFIIKYRAKNIINFFDTHEEFYWNISGTEWPVPVKNITAEIQLPQKFDEKDINLECITGEYGSKEKNCTILLSKNTLQSTQKIAAQAMKNENLSIIIGMPNNTFEKPALIESTWEYIKTSLPIIPVPITFGIMFLLWYKRGRDEKILRTTIMPHYKAPNNLLPAETGTIIDESIDPRDITATIIDYAIKGHIVIHEIEKKQLIGKHIDYELELIKPYQIEDLKEFEQLILGAIFPKNVKGEKTKMETLQNDFQKHVMKIKKSVMGNLVNEDYFPTSPDKIKLKYFLIGGGVAFLGGGYLETETILGLSIFISGMIIAGFGQIMPRKTKKGTETYYELKGLYEYINTAEKDRLKFQEDNNIMFERLLPYAIAFGIAQKWASAFEGLITTPPNWYSSSSNAFTTFSMLNFSKNIGKFGSNMTNSIISAPGSRGGKGAWSGGSGFGGGGFSGGGFGGGGGRGL